MECCLDHQIREFVPSQSRLFSAAKSSDCGAGRLLRRKIENAFTLVEVSLATGIVAIAVIVIFGLMAPGLDMFRNAIDKTVTAQIAQRVITDAEQAEFDLLIADAGEAGAQFLTLPTRYFDEQGAEVSPTAEGAEVNVLYHVLARVSRPGPRDASQAGAGFTSLPATPGLTRFEPRDSVFLTVQVARRPGTAELTMGENSLWKTEKAVPINTYRTVITRNGYAQKKSL